MCYRKQFMHVQGPALSYVRMHVLKVEAPKAGNSC